MKKNIRRIIIILICLLIILFLLNIVRRDANAINESMIEELEDKVLHKNDDEQTENANTNSNLINNISYIEISVEDTKSKEGIAYLENQKITTKEVLAKVKSIVNGSTLCDEKEFEAKYGVGGYLEGCPILTVYDENGDKITIVPLDDFGKDNNDGVGINIMSIYKNDDESNKCTYQTTAKMQEFVEGLYSK